MRNSKPLSQHLYDLAMLALQQRARLLEESIVLLTDDKPAPLSDRAWPDRGQITPEIQSHPAFKWLNEQEEYRTAIEYFHRRQKKPGASHFHLVAREVRWLSAIASSASMALSGEEWIASTFSRQQRDQAAKYSSQLLNSLEKGIWRSKLEKTQDLIQLLVDFVNDMSSANARQYGGSDALQREVLISMASQLKSLSLPRKDVVTLTVLLAPMMGFDPSHRSVQRYVRAAFQAPTASP